MVSLKNKPIYLLTFLIIVVQSCNNKINERTFVGVYQAKTKDFRDTLWINHDHTYYHAYYEGKYKFYQTGNWKPTVKGYFELVDWKTDSTSFGGADILPIINRINSSIKFSYPLVSNSIEYIKIVE